MKYIKIVLIAVLAIVLPFALLKASLECDGLTDLGTIVLYTYPIALPVFCGWFGVQLFKTGGKVLLPTLIFNLFMVVSICFLSEWVFRSIERSLADVLIALLLYGPMVISVPVSPVAAAIYKHKKKKYEALSVDEVTINEQ